MTTGPFPTDPGYAATLPPAPAAATLSLAEAAAVPEHVSVPGYEIIEELGRGGMGVVYKARQTGLNRDVALKMILAGGHASAGDMARFKSEAEAVAKLQHPKVVQVYEVGEAGGLPYFSLEFCPGGSLQRRLGGMPLPPKQAAELIETLAQAVHAAHQAGVIHRDLKPGNVLLAAGDIPKVTDFGLAKQIDSGTGRTATGAILGTPSYMAPEQASASKEIGPAADTYALGAILYELLTGRPPFKAATPLDTVLQVVSAEPVPPTRLNTQVPRDLETIALKCLQKDPAKRYPSAAALADDLRRWQTGEPITARPAGRVEKAAKWAKRRPAVVALAAGIVLAIAGGFAGVLYELRIAETQEALANQRADALADEQLRVRRELHGSDLLRADLLLQSNDAPRAEQVLWRAHFTRPDEDDRRAYWRLWELYHQRPRRSGVWLGAPAIGRLSSDGRRLFALGKSKVTIYDAATGTIACEVDTPQSDLASVYLSHDGGRLAKVSMDDGSIAVWDLGPKPTLRATLAPPSPFRPSLTMALGGALADLPKEQVRRAERLSAFRFTRVCFLSGDRILVAVADKAALWSLRGPTLLAQCDLAQATGMIPAISGGEGMPLDSGDDTIPIRMVFGAQLWELPKTPGGSIIRTRLDFSDPTRVRRIPVDASKGRRPDPDDPALGGVLLSPEGKWLVTNNRGHLRVWEMASGARRAELQVQDGNPAYLSTAFSLTPDGSAIRAVDHDTIRLWRLPGLEPIRTVKLLDPGAFGYGAVFGHGGMQTIGINDRTVKVYDHQPPEAVRPLLPPNRREQVGSKKDLVATGPAIGTDVNGVAIWHEGREDRIAIPSGITPQPADALLTSDGSRAVVVQSGLFSSSVAVYDLKTRRATVKFTLSDPNGKSLRMAGLYAMSPDGNTVVVLSMSRVYLVDLPAKKAVPVVSEPFLSMIGLFTPDGRAVLCRNFQDKKLRFVSVADGAELVQTQIDMPARDLAFSPDGAVLLEANDHGLTLRDGRSLGAIAEIPAMTRGLQAAAFAPDGRLVVTGGSDGKLRLWDARRREELVAIDLAAGPIRKVVLTPDSSKVRFIAEKQVGEFDLHAYDTYVDGNLTWNLLRLLPELEKSDADRVLNHLREEHPDAYRAGVAAKAVAR
jgi:WD40 repeat protein